MSTMARMKRPPPTIAVVDDDLAVRKAMMRLLEASSYQVKTYESGSEFFADLHMAVPECVIVDLQMPDMTGLELQRQLLRLEIDIATIVMTAYDEPNAKERCLAAGAVAYLLKPVRKAALITAIEIAVRA